MRSWRVLLDGRPVDEVGSGETRELYVVPGRHRLAIMEGRFFGSPSVDFNIARDQVLDYETRARPVAQVLLRFLNRKAYITLDQHSPYIA